MISKVSKAILGLIKVEKFKVAQFEGYYRCRYFVRKGYGWKKLWANLTFFWALDYLDYSELISIWGP